MTDLNLPNPPENIPGLVPEGNPTQPASPYYGAPPTQPVAPPPAGLYGAAQPAAYGAYATGGAYQTGWNPVATQRNGLGVAALICGIGGLVIIPFLPSIAAIILGHMGLGANRRGEASNRGMCIGGLVTGYIGAIFWALFFVIVIVIGVGVAVHDSNYSLSALAAPIWS